MNLGCPVVISVKEEQESRRTRSPVEPEEVMIESEGECGTVVTVRTLEDVWGSSRC